MAGFSGVFVFSSVNNNQSEKEANHRPFTKSWQAFVQNQKHKSWMKLVETSSIIKQKILKVTGKGSRIAL